MCSMFETNEIWKDIVGYEGYYQISNKGRVKRNGRYTENNGRMIFLKEKILKQKVGNAGYLRVGLSKNKKQKWFLVHRLVAQSFIPNIENKPDVNHIDYDVSNNCVENLEWCTKEENMKHSYERCSKARTGIIKNHKNNSGHHHVNIHTFVKGNKKYTYYRVGFGGSGRMSKEFKTLDEAIAYRDSIIKSKAYTSSM